jgi:hypothetical protein
MNHENTNISDSDRIMMSRLTAMVRAIRAGSVQMLCGNQQTNRRCEIFGDHCAGCYAAHAHVKTEHEPGVEQHVADVQHQLQQQGGARLAQSNEPAEQGIVGKRCRCGPDANIKVTLRQLLNPFACFQ